MIRTIPLTRHNTARRSLHTFTRPDLATIQKCLLPLPTSPLTSLPPHTNFPSARIPAESAVLVPLMNIDGEAHILLQIRSASMRVHAGEASFPGGKADPEDACLVHTALRETNEELGIDPACVELLGALEPQYSLGNRARVWPIVGFIHHTPIPIPTSPSPSPSPALLSPPLTELVLSPTEVDAILPLPLSALSPSRQTIHFFRVAPHRPYFKIRAGDFALPKTAHIDPGLEVWGLSGWFLNVLAWKCGWMGKPSVPPSEG